MLDKTFFKFTFGFIIIIAISFFVINSLNYFDNKDEGEQQEIIASVLDIFRF